MRKLLLLPVILLMFSCDRTAERGETTIHKKGQTTPRITPGSATHDVESHFPGSLKDTLLVNMITFIHKRPTTAINRDRTDPEFREYYVQQLDQYRFVHHHMTADSTHWFYLLRPARHVDGDKRGAGGRFRTNERLQMVEFEEIFNTPVLPEDQLLSEGRILFEEMISQGNVDAFLDDGTKIEWPDDRLKYDIVKREWRYDVN